MLMIQVQHVKNKQIKEIATKTYANTKTKIWVRKHGKKTVEKVLNMGCR